MLQNLAFLYPAVLWSLLALPIIWWLLRATPPQPQRIRFPATRLLKGLQSQQQTPAKSPWWLTLIRLLAAAAVIAALAEPVLNPRTATIAGSGPLVLVVDNGWSAGAHWEARRQSVIRYLDEAAGARRSVVLVPTAMLPGGRTPGLVTPQEARDQLEALRPQPFAPDRLAAIGTLAPNLPAGARTVVWLSDGLDHGSARAFADRLVALAAGGAVTVLEPGATERPLAIRLAQGTTGSALAAEVLSPGGVTRDLVISAVSSAGQSLAETRIALTAGQTVATAAVDLPLELRNQIARFELVGERSAGGVALLDAGSRWNRVGLISGASREQAQPLLAPLFYLERALAPFSDLVKTDDPNTSGGIDALLKRNVSILVLADIGRLNEATEARVRTWVEDGGVLVRFAGPRLEEGGDTLLPVPLRLGGRALGGALSWGTPQALAAFEDDSPFAGLAVSPDVKISRQVLADPALLGDETRIWARLADGTPLVTAARRKGGWLVLFHVTANSDWSSLPISGLFVDMLRRIVRLTGLADFASGAEATDVTQGSAVQQQASVLPPGLTLDGFGVLGPPPPFAEALLADANPDTVPSVKNPPGLYGPPGAVRALNVAGRSTTLAPLSSLPVAVERASYAAGETVPLKPWALLAAFGLVLADILAVIGLQTGGFRHFRPLRTGVLLGVVALTSIIAPTPRAVAQNSADAALSAEAFALKAAERTRLAFVITGDPATDENSLRGLQGLSLLLAARTAVEPDTPIGVRLDRDELAFFPVLYWPILPDAQPLDAAGIAKIDSYIKGGGMIVFDTRDAGEFSVTVDGEDSPGTRALRRIVGKLDVPPLEPTPLDHVLAYSFYRLKEFPGRYDASPMWVEAARGAENRDAQNIEAQLFGNPATGAASAEAAPGDRPVRQDDGVSAILVTGNDLAGAWAVDEDGQPMNPVVPGGEEQREMAFRVGVNIVMYALTGNYKSDQVHVPALLERLGQ